MNGVHVSQEDAVSANSNVKLRIGPSGLHIFYRRTGMNFLLDEITADSNLWAAAPRQMSIALTNICDLNCPHCYAPKNKSMLSIGQVVGWLHELDHNGCMGVGFGGGEPTLFPRFAELCSRAANETKLAVTMTTHGHHLKDQTIDALAGNVHFARISMDGVHNTYEAIRRRSFDALLQRIRAIGKIVPFGINYVVNSATIRDLNAALEIAVDLGAAEFLLLPEVPVGRGSGIDNKTKSRLREWVAGQRYSVRLSISECGSEGFPVCRPLKAERGLSAYVHIDASGVLKRTSYDLDGIVIRQEGIMSALRHLRLTTGD